MKILVTAGPTREPIDPVRFISNRSTGKMGYALAEMAEGRGHEVRLVSGPVGIEPSGGVVVIDVVTAEEMLRAVEENVGWCDVLIMTAAVADWRPKTQSPDKIKKSDGPMDLQLERTADILCALKGKKEKRFFVGFSADTADMISEAKRKLEAKGLDLVVANDITRPDSGFGVDTNKVTIIAPNGSINELPLMTKLDAAAEIVKCIEEKVSHLE